MKKETVQILVNAASVFVATLTFLFGSGIILKSCDNSADVNSGNISDESTLSSSQDFSNYDAAALPNSQDSSNDNESETINNSPDGPFFLSFDDAYSMNNYLDKDVYFTLLTDNYGTTYNPNRVITVRDYAGLCAPATIEYYLDSSYKTLTGIIYIPEVSKSVSGTPYVEIYGDDVLLYELPEITSKEHPINFEVDVSNVEFLLIRIDGYWFRGDGSGSIPKCCIADLAVTK